MQRLRTILSITAIRLSIAFTVIFGIMSVLIVLYMTGSTVGILRRQIQTSINTEIADLVQIYETGGLNQFFRTIERAAAAPGANLYVVADPAGQIIAANIGDIESGVIDRDGWTRHPFKYSRLRDRGQVTYNAVARVFPLPNGMRLLIGRDLGEPERYRAVVGRSLIVSLLAMLLFGLSTWLFVGRRALKRLDMVGRSAERILSGDRHERLPVTGAGDEFDRISERLNAMLDRIERLDEGLRQVSDNIAHDLKTPLTRLRNKADAALTKPQTSSQAIYEIIADTDRIIKTFDALLMISRVESGSAAAELSPLDLSALVADFSELYEPVAEEAGFSTEIAVQPDIRIRGNRELLSQALSNLAENALKYGFEESGARELSISVSAENHNAHIVVADRGPGIAPADRERATERFARLEKSRTLPGNGLGLSLARAVTELHGGSLVLEDNLPGLRSKLVLPLAAEAKP